MTTLEILIAGRARIDTPERWTRGDWARDANGVGVEPLSPDAVCFCAMGAVDAAAASEEYAVYLRAVAALRDAIPKGLRLISVPTYQDCDTTTHADVMAMFDRAIEAERAKELAQ
jgi:hypothetical protein